MDNITEQLVRFLKQKKKDFISLSALKTGKEKLPPSLWSTLGLKGKSDMKVCLAPYLEDSLVFLKKGNACFLALKQSERALMSRLLEKQRNVRVSGLLRRVPFIKKHFLKIIEEMIADGTVLVTLDEKDYVPRITLSSLALSSTGHVFPAKSAIIPTENVITQTSQSEEAFRSAFAELSKGRNFLKIYSLRRYLSWPREAFDVMLRRLRDNGSLQIQTGDVENINQKDIDDSFIDENGFLMLTLMWSRNP